MRRREFVSLLTGAAASSALDPLATRAQQPRKLSTVGFLVPGTKAAYAQWTNAFAQRLHDLGWTEDRNLKIEYRWSEGYAARATEIAVEFARLKVDVIVTSGSVSAIAARQASSTIPIVFAATSDPVAAGLVESLARPGGNVTGLSAQSTDYAGKQVELLREIVPTLRRLAILTDADSPGAMLEADQVQAAARTLGIEPVMLAIRQVDDIVPAFDGLKARADALYCVPGPLSANGRVRIVTSALAAKMPTSYGSRNYVDAGGLMSYGPNITDLFRRAADFVDKILRGTKPADIPVEQPTKFYLFINRTTANVLGITLPQSILLLADEVIE